MDTWKRSFLDRLHEAQSRCASKFEEALNAAVVPVFEELSSFLRDNGFDVSSPLNEQGRRSFKFELAENAYLLLIFKFSGVGEFELRSETFIPGADPLLEKSVGRVADLEESWAQDLFQTSLDVLVDLLAGEKQPEPEPELAAV